MPSLDSTRIWLSYILSWVSSHFRLWASSHLGFSCIRNCSTKLGRSWLTLFKLLCIVFSTCQRDVPFSGQGPLKIHETVLSLQYWIQFSWGRSKWSTKGSQPHLHWANLWYLWPLVITEAWDHSVLEHS